MTELAEFLGELFPLLDRAGVEYMVTGSLASTYYSEPRSTVDVDIVVTASPANLVAFAESLDRARFYAPSNESILADTQFNVIALEGAGWKLDVMIRQDRPFSVTEFARRRSVTLLGVETFIASPEDVILAKLEWAKDSSSERQFRDVRAIIEMQDDTLDIAYLRKWARELSVSDALTDVLGSEGPGRDR